MHIRTFALTSTAILAAAAVPLSAAWSQTAAEAGGLEEIVVTARKHEEQVQTTPLAITAFSSAKLEQIGLVNLEKLSSLAPNLVVSQGAGGNTVGGSNIYLRGVGQSDIDVYNDSPVATYVDGVLAARSSVNLFDLVDMERIEVLRGPQATLFGRNTTGGAISVITKVPSETPGGKVKFGAATQAEFEGQALVNTGNIGGSPIRAKLAVTRHQRGGYVDNIRADNNSDPGAVRSTQARAGLYADFDPLILDYRFDWTEQHLQALAGQATAATAAVQQYYGLSPALGGDPFIISTRRLGKLAITAPTPDNKLFIRGHALTATYSPLDALTIKSITGYRGFRQTARTNNTSQGNMLGPILSGSSTVIGPVTPYTVFATPTNQHQWSEELQALGEIGDFKYVAGYYYFNEKFGSYNPQLFTFVTGGGTLGVNSTAVRAYEGMSKSNALFGQVSWRPSMLRDLEVTGGLRYTRDSKSLNQHDLSNGLPSTTRQLANKWDDTSYMASVSYQLTPDVMSFFRVASSYKAGGYSPGSAGPAYNPEKATVYELGVKSDWFDRHARVNATIFRTDYKDLQVQNFIVNPSGSIATVVNNAGKARYQGAELEAILVPAAGFQLDTSLGYVLPKYLKYMFGTIDVADEAHFPYTSKWTTNVGGQYTRDVGIGDLTLRLDYSWRSKRWFFPLTRNNPFNDVIADPGQHNLGARIILSKIQLGVATGQVEIYGDNLTNEAHRVGGIDFGALGIATASYGRMRSFGVTLRAEY